MLLGAQRLARPLRLSGAGLRRCWRLLAIAALLGVGALLFVLARVLMPWRPLSGSLQTLVQPWMRLACASLGVQLSRAGVRPPRGSLLLANHISWLDIVVIAAMQPVRFVAKAEVRQWPLIGLLADAGGTLFLQRGQRDGKAGSAAMRETIEAVLASGQSVLVFPEGTTTDGGEVRRFHSRLLTGRRAVFPVAIGYRGRGASQVPFIGDDDFASSLWRLVAERDIHAHVQCLHAEPPAPTALQACQARSRVASALGLAVEAAAA